MAKNVNEIMQKLPRDRVEKIEARAAELIAEYNASGYPKSKGTYPGKNGRTFRGSSG